jgi:hypothetical protein
LFGLGITDATAHSFDLPTGAIGVRTQNVPEILRFNDMAGKE